MLIIASALCAPACSAGACSRSCGQLQDSYQAFPHHAPCQRGLANMCHLAPLHLHSLPVPTTLYSALLVLHQMSGADLSPTFLQTCNLLLHSAQISILQFSCEHHMTSSHCKAIRGHFCLLATLMKVNRMGMKAEGDEGGHNFAGVSPGA